LFQALAPLASAHLRLVTPIKGLCDGGSIEQQRHAVEKMASYLNLPVDDAVYGRLSEIDDSSAPTFRIDQMDEWKSAVGAKIIERVMAYCEPLCHEAGYE